MRDFTNGRRGYERPSIKETIEFNRVAGPKFGDVYKRLVELEKRIEKLERDKKHEDKDGV